MDQFHRNEAISAVADDEFLAEEDDDYEDLYNDVSVREGFLQSLRKNTDSGFRNRGNEMGGKGVGGTGSSIGVGGGMRVELGSGVVIIMWEYKGWGNNLMVELLGMWAMKVW